MKPITEILLTHQGRSGLGHSVNVEQKRAIVTSPVAFTPYSLSSSGWSNNESLKLAAVDTHGNGPNADRDEFQSTWDVYASPTNTWTLSTLRVRSCTFVGCPGI
jgi:hypothetical protein